jgi:hypothetical protein
MEMRWAVFLPYLAFWFFGFLILAHLHFGGSGENHFQK